MTAHTCHTPIFLFFLQEYFFFMEKIESDTIGTLHGLLSTAVGIMPESAVCSGAVGTIPTCFDLGLGCLFLLFIVDSSQLGEGKMHEKTR